MTVPQRGPRLRDQVYKALRAILRDGGRSRRGGTGTALMDASGRDDGTIW